MYVCVCVCVTISRINLGKFHTEDLDIAMEEKR